MIQTYQGTFRKLVAWQVAKELTKVIYKLANKFPKEELYGLAAQMKRSAVSVMSNLAEGNQRSGNTEKIRFFNIAHSSLTELDNQCELAYELGYIVKKDFDEFLELNNKTGYLIFRLIESKKNPTNPTNLTNLTNPNKKGFSLVELIVVAAIIAIMSVSGVVGFRYMGDTLRTKEAAGVITDTVKKAEMEIMREEYAKNTIHFLSDYLVIVSEPADKSLGLTVSDCTEGRQLNYGSNGNLVKTDGDGNRLEIKTVASGTNDCIIDFPSSDETEWRYQLTDSSSPDTKFSDIIRFIHFNVDRVNLSDIKVTGGEGKTVAIEAPYGKKTITDGTFNLTVTSPENHQETLTIQ
jgi:four helix bundle protein